LFSLRTHILLTLACLGLMLALAGGLHLLQESGYLTDPARLSTYAMAGFFALFVAFGFSLVPIVLKVFIRGQRAIGNAEVPMVAGLARHERGVVVGVWLFMLAGLALAVPAAIEDGFFTPPGVGPESDAAPMGTLGTLSARPGMDVATMRRISTLTFADDQSAANALELVFSGGGPFDFELEGSPTVFHGCRYYFVNTYSASDKRIQAISIGTSPSKLAKPLLDAANAKLQAQLAREGWQAGHEVYASEENQALHGGAKVGPSGWVWLYDGTVLHIMNRRLDDPLPGEDPASAGQWIQYVDLWQKADYPGIEFLAFDPAQP
jgi:hypothetical protein